MSKLYSLLKNATLQSDDRAMAGGFDIFGAVLTFMAGHWYEFTQTFARLYNKNMMFISVIYEFFDILNESFIR